MEFAKYFYNTQYKVEYSWLDKDLVIHNDVAEAVFLPRNMLAVAVTQPLNEGIKTSIEINGMMHPLIAVKNSKKNYKEAVVGLSNKCKFDASKKWLVVYGNQRVPVLDALGALAVPVILADNAVEAMAIHTVLIEGDPRESLLS